MLLGSRNQNTALRQHNRTIATTVNTQPRLGCSEEPKCEHPTQMKIKGESERKSLTGGMLQGLQKRHLRGKDAARAPRETTNEQAKRRH